MPATGNGAVTGLGASGSVLVAGGNGGSGLWRSTNAGASWQRHEIELDSAYWGLNDLTASDELLVGVGSNGNESGDMLLIITSTNDGETWSEADLGDIDPAGRQRAFTVEHANDAWWVISRRSTGISNNPDVCYLDTASCSGGSTPIVLHSADGEQWNTIDLSLLNPPDFFSIDSVMSTDGMVALVGSAEGQLTAWQWSSTAAPSFEKPAAVQETLDSELVEWDANLEPGVTYRYPLYIHCGMDHLANFNSSHWYLPSGANQQTQPDWPMAEQAIFGFVTLNDEGTIGYSINDGEIIATYTPSAEEPPGCD